MINTKKIDCPIFFNCTFANITGYCPELTKGKSRECPFLTSHKRGKICAKLLLGIDIDKIFEND